MLEHDIDGIVSNYFINSNSSTTLSEKFSSQSLIEDLSNNDSNIEFSGEK